MDYTKEYASMAKQMSGAYKTAMDNSFQTMAMIQESTEKLISQSLDKSPWVPEESKKFVNDWINACKKGAVDFKAAADEHYKKFAAFAEPKKNA